MKIEADQAEQWSFEAFATAHPHEAYETWPERFWAFFHHEHPHVSREQMEAVLKETVEHPKYFV